MLVVQIVLWIQTFRYSRSEWNDQRKACVILSTAPNPLIVAVFSYTMAFDFVIMALCSYRLYKARSSSAISNLLFRDGIVSRPLLRLHHRSCLTCLQVYFAAAFGANLVQAVLAALTLNQVMNIVSPLPHSIQAASSCSRNAVRPSLRPRRLHHCFHRRLPQRLHPL